MLRAKIVLTAADGVANVAIARRLDVSVTTVSVWRKPFFEHGLAGLAERKRSGRPQAFSPLVHAEAVALACELPARALPAAPARLALPAGESAVEPLPTPVDPAVVFRCGPACDDAGSHAGARRRGAGPLGRGGGRR